MVSRRWFTAFAEQGVVGFSSHRPALWAALEAQRHVPGWPRVVELGSGLGSTPFLAAWCEERGVELTTYEPSPHWASLPLFDGHRIVLGHPDPGRSWADVGVILVDHAPAEERSRVLRELAAADVDFRGIAVVHDWNRPGYGFEKLPAGLFRYQAVDETTRVERHTALLSNWVDVRGLLDG